MTSDGDEIARLRAAFTAPAGPPAPQACPAPETIWSAVRGELSPAELRTVIDHTAACPACAEDWRLAADFEHDAIHRDAVRDAAPARSPWRLAGWAAAVAAAVVLAVGLPRLDLPWFDRAPAWRDAAPDEPRPLVADDAALPRGRFVLRWTAVPGATYDVRVSTEDLVVIAADRGLTAPSYRVAPAALARFPAGTRLIWQVEATLPDGRRLAAAISARVVVR